MRSSSSNLSLTIYTTCSSSQSRETVPLIFIFRSNIFLLLSDQSESVFHLFLFSHWLNVFFFPVSSGSGRYSRSDRKRLLLTFHFPRATGEICQCWYDKIAANVVFLYHLTAKTGKWDVIRGLASTLAAL
jgi:hypothetical protein